MPLYEYECTECGQVSEVLQRLSDAPLTDCSSCGGRLRKLLSAPAFQFKGTGWYVTDYARKGQSSGEPSADKAGKSGDGSSSSDAGAAKSDNSAKSTKSTKSDKKSKPAGGSSSSD